MKKYDDIVVGSGVSGLTLALLLALNGRKVLIIEKSPHIGGALARFYKNGVPCDTGFHFTGGFYKNGILTDMIKVLGIQNYIEPIILDKEKSNCFVFEKENTSFEMPLGIANIRNKLKSYFPSETNAIDVYFDKIIKVCDKTVSMDLRKISMSPETLEEDYITLEDFLNKLTSNKLLKGFLSSYCMCYGVKPTEVSFSNHARVAYGLYESVARVKDGGESFIKAFRTLFKDLPIDIKCSAYITELKDIKEDYVGKFVLNNGEEIESQCCTFTIHPKEILGLLPKDHFKKAFFNRVNSFESSLGFFSLFAVLEDDNADNFDPSIVSLFPSAEINEFLNPEYKGTPALVIIKSLETLNGKNYKVLSAFETSFVEHVEKWKSSKLGDRPGDYLVYKQQRTKSIVERIKKFYPEYDGKLKILDTASILTFRDYLNSYDGSAYGIKQKMGQYSLFGKLALRNLYAAGQSAVLPGIVGAMLSSFIVARSIVGKEDYNQFIEKRLC